MNHTTGNNFEDRHLVETVLNGDTKSFGIIIRQTERLVLKIVFKMISNEEDRKDIAQDIYLKVFTKLGSFKFQSKLSTWIAQISYNTCFDYLRKKNIVIDSSPFDSDIDQDGSGMAITDLNTGRHTVYVLEQKQMSDTIKKCEEKLSPLYRTLITLFHHEEMSYEEIGRITSLPAGTVKSYLFRARRQLKEMMLGQYKKEDIC